MPRRGFIDKHKFWISTNLQGTSDPTHRFVVGTTGMHIVNFCGTVLWLFSPDQTDWSTMIVFILFSINWVSSFQSKSAGGICYGGVYQLCVFNESISLHSSIWAQCTNATWKRRCIKSTQMMIVTCSAICFTCVKNRKMDTNPITQMLQYDLPINNIVTSTPASQI